MALAVSDIFEDGGTLLAEAGTGIGKTLAYLVPAILSRHRVLISTGTKNLQDQIYYKDLPALHEVLGVPFTATYMKGRANYLCLHHFADLVERDEPRTPVERAYLDTLTQWVDQTDTGDRSEIEDLPDDVPLWNDIAATSENCIGSDCARYDDCFITRMRQRAMESDLVVVNHHLLCTDAAVRHGAYGEVIPSCAYMIIDEAHQLEDVATQYFGLSVSSYRLDELARDAHRVAPVNSDTDPLLIARIRQAVDVARDHARSFFNSLLRLCAAGTRLRANADVLAPAADIAVDLIEALTNLETLLVEIENASTETLALARRTVEIRDQLKFLLDASDSDFVYFLESRGRAVFLRALPIDVSAIVRDRLLHRNAGTILTSATLTVDGSFTYIRDRLGLDDAL